MRTVNALSRRTHMRPRTRGAALALTGRADWCFTATTIEKAPHINIYADTAIADSPSDRLSDLDPRLLRLASVMRHSLSQDLTLAARGTLQMLKLSSVRPNASRRLRGDILAAIPEEIAKYKGVYARPAEDGQCILPRTSAQTAPWVYLPLSSITTTWSARTSLRMSEPPPIQRTSMRSMRSRLPRPKCRRIPKCPW